MKKKRIAKRAATFVMLCTLSTVLLAEPAFATVEPYKLVDGGQEKAVSAERILACQQMEKMSKSKWTISTPLYYFYGADHSATTRMLNAGSYQGVPYTQVDREHSYLGNANITLKYGTDTYKVGNITYRSVYGTDCSSSIDFAWRKGTGNVNGDFLRTTDSKKELYRTRHMFNDGIAGQKLSGTAGDYLKLVGKYGDFLNNPARRDSTTTEPIVKGLSAAGNYTQDLNQEVYKDIYSQVYADMKPGDALLRRTSSFGHVRLVTGVDIKYTYEVKADGKTWKVVDPVNSKVTCIEQSGFRANRSDWKTSWMPNNLDGTKYDGVYSFAELSGEAKSYNLAGNLVTAYYVPIELRALEATD